MYCHSCGIPLTQQMKYCNRCGALLIKSNGAADLKRYEKLLDKSPASVTENTTRAFEPVPNKPYDN